MAPIIDQPRQAPPEFFDPLATSRPVADVPGLMADRIGSLYAEEERRDRLARTERLIRQAEALQ